MVVVKVSSTDTRREGLISWDADSVGWRLKQPAHHWRLRGSGKQKMFSSEMDFIGKSCPKTEYNYGLLQF